MEVLASKKDILNLVYIADSYGLSEVADYWRQVINLNDYQQTRFVKTMLRNMFNTLASKKIAILGFAFKANTGDTRESPAIYVTRKLLEEHAQIVISDPRAIENAKSDLSDVLDRISFESNPIEACKGAHAIAILTEWEEYRDIDFELIYEQMHKPAFIFDDGSILDHQKLQSIGFNVFPIGKEPLLSNS